MKKFMQIAGITLVPAYIIGYVLFFGSCGSIKEDTKAETQIMELWHVDMFEGGSGSRAEYLRQRALEFEKVNKSKFILIKNMTYEQVILSLSEGRSPDMFSFSSGLACDILADLRAFEGNCQIYENILDSGVIENKLFAVPWCSGGYIIAAINEYITGENHNFASILASSHQKKGNSTLYSFTTGYALFNNPMLAVFISNKNTVFNEKSFDQSKNLTQYEAYSKFISKNASVFLLGTQRDAVRLCDRENAADFSLQAVKGFTDLVCYIGISKNTAANSSCQSFIEYLLGEAAQRKLTQINMFSVNIGGLYNEGIMKDIESALSEAFVLNVFMSKEILNESKTTALNALKGDSASAEKISGMLP
jgi:hypothetical protein